MLYKLCIATSILLGFGDLAVKKHNIYIIIIVYNIQRVSQLYLSDKYSHHQILGRTAVFPGKIPSIFQFYWGFHLYHFQDITTDHHVNFRPTGTIHILV